MAPLVERLAAAGRGAVSVDTYKPAVARAAIEAGAAIVNDPSGLIDPEVADVCASSGRGAGRDPHARAPEAEARAPALRRRGRRREAPPGRAARGGARGAACRTSGCWSAPARTSARTPRRRSSCCAASTSCTTLGLPVLLAVSRKDFVGALTDAAAARAAGRHARGGRARPRPRGARAARPRRRRDARLPHRARARCAATWPCRADLLLADDLRREPIPQEASAAAAKEAAA